MDSLVIRGNKNKLEALELIDNLYDEYDGNPEVDNFIIKVFYSYGKPVSVTVTFNGSNEFKCGKEDTGQWT